MVIWSVSVWSSGQCWCGQLVSVSVGQSCCCSVVIIILQFLNISKLLQIKAFHSSTNTKNKCSLKYSIQLIYKYEVLKYTLCQILQNSKQ